MEVDEARPVAHGDVGQARDRGERAVHGRLVRQVERRRRLVEDAEPRPRDEHAREGEALLLAERELVAPVAHRVEVRRREAAEAARLERGAQVLVARGRLGDRLRVDELLPQRAERRVRPLRQEDGLVPRGAHDGALAAVPEARDGAEQRRLAGARRARHQQVVAAADLEREVPEELAVAVGRLEAEAVDREHGAARGRRLGRLDAARRRGARLVPQHEGRVRVDRALARVAVALHALDERREAAEPRRERRQALELVHDQTQVVEDVVEGARRLRHDAELDRAREVERRHDEHGQDLHEVRVRRREELEVPLRAQDLALVRHGAVEARADLLGLAGLAAVERDRLRVLAQAHEAVAQVRLLEQLLRVLADDCAGAAPRFARASREGKKDAGAGRVLPRATVVSEPKVA
mgnify:CR=1 FL=1